MAARSKRTSSLGLLGHNDDQTPARLEKAPINPGAASAARSFGRFLLAVPGTQRRWFGWF